MAQITSGTWTSLTPLPEAKSNGWLLTDGGYLYYVGGVTPASGPGTKQVYSARINTDGTINGWNLAGVAPKNMGFFSGVITGGQMVLAGGNAAQPVNSVYMAPMGIGEVGQFVYTAAPISSYRNPGTAAWNGRVYYVGGTANAGGQEVFIGRLAPALQDSTWERGTPLPSARTGGICFAYRGWLFYAGGTKTSSAAGATGEVVSAPINGDGTLGSWRVAGTMPKGIHRFAGVLYNDRFIALGGQGADSVNSDKIFHAQVNGDGTLGMFETDDITLPVAHRNSCAAVVGSRLFLASGYTTTYMKNVWSIPLRF